MGLVKPTVAPICLIAGASLVLAACATLPHLEYPLDHPANPEAPASVAALPLSTLSTYKSFPSATTQANGAAPNADQGPVPQDEQPSEEGPHEHHH